MDREKVIKELTDLAEFLFAEYKEATTWQETSKWYNRFLTVNDALELLKEREAKTVVKIAKRFNDCDLTGYCPSCSRPLIKDWAENYCGYCGKPVL